MTDTMMLLMEILVSGLLVLAGVFGLVGSLGLLKLPDLMTRLHAPTKATTLGVGGALIASMLYFGVFMDQFSFHELMITLFLFLTAPISANLIAKAHVLREEQPEKLPPTGAACGWATFDETADPSRPPEA
ncbi:multisubunit potassium/proton antiporter, PhaG subunit [Gemmobacter megaterium]|uniref:Multisubunit potassium/proton antiporter, PhaG subunit n=1 Tax=Gemmobacter megaterium TaxID=1086013 RepID=A0A1N7PE32_9RHOB|nr:Na+/H+ antiporter subunit G [Gemmobacter megaterium]SIT08639.1 multisubunit potassium/proton antiporter, PhaG subunit [Gemmobacter megaterium]